MKPIGMAWVIAPPATAELAAMSFVLLRWVL